MATRNFKQVFKLADYVKVANATLGNGLLSVDLVRDIPEQLKPRRIDIGTSADKHPSPNKQIRQDIEHQRNVA
jgi:molecular chaperone IbpA